MSHITTCSIPAACHDPDAVYTALLPTAYMCPETSLTRVVAEGENVTEVRQRRRDSRWTHESA